MFLAGAIFHPRELVSFHDPTAVERFRNQQRRAREPNIAVSNKQRNGDIFAPAREGKKRDLKLTTEDSGGVVLSIVHVCRSVPVFGFD